MIPKIIHLCWLSGDPYPEKIARCISTWKKHLPDYEIMLWDTKRFDVNSTVWTKQAYEAGKYAFVSDYIRFYAVYNYGGIYLDSDVEVLKSFNPLLDLPYFVGEEADKDHLEVAAFGAKKGSPWVKACLDYYSDRPFIVNGVPAIMPCPYVLSDMLFDSGKFNRQNIASIAAFSRNSDVICVFPHDFFCSHIHTRPGVVSYDVTDNSYCVHHFTNTWVPVAKRGPLHCLYAWLTGREIKYLGREIRFFDK